MWYKELLDTSAVSPPIPRRGHVYTLRKTGCEQTFGMIFSPLLADYIVGLLNVNEPPQYMADRDGYVFELSDDGLTYSLKLDEELINYPRPFNFKWTYDVLKEQGWQGVTELDFPRLREQVKKRWEGIPQQPIELTPEESREFDRIIRSGEAKPKREPKGVPEYVAPDPS